MLFRLAKRLFLCLAVLGVVAVKAGAQQDYPIRTFAMVPIKGELFLRGELQKEDEQNRLSGFETSEKDLFFEEGIELRTSGYFYHPNLVEWDASLRLGLEQQRIDIDGENFNSDGDLIGYNLSAIILKEKPVSFRVFASQTQDILDRDFARRLAVERTQQGLEIMTKGRFPMSLLLENIKLSEESDLRLEDQKTQQLRFSITDQRDPDWQAKLIYEHEDTEETSIFLPSGGGSPITSDLPVARDELNISYLRRFGSGPEKHQFSGNIRVLDRRGWFVDQIISANQRLDLVHSETLVSFYQLLFSMDKTEFEKERFVNGEVGFTKSIYQSLDITGRALFTDRSFENGSESIFGGFLNLNYRKNTGLGYYTSTLLLGKDYEKEESEAGLRSIRDEAVTLTGFLFSSLSEPNVLGTLKVTDLAESTTYVEGTDYTVSTVGTFTEIARLAGGGIGNGDTVLVDYTAQVARDAEFTTDHVNWTNRLKMKRLPIALYFDYQLRDERLQSGDDPGNLDTLEVKLAGVELDYKGLTFTAEHEEREQILFPPSSSERLRVGYRSRLSRNFSLSLGGELQKLNYEKAAQFGLDPDRAFLDTMRAYGLLTAKIRSNMLLRLKGDYIRTQGRENDKLVRLGVDLEWRYRNLDFSLQGRHDIFRQQSAEGTTDFVGFYLKRRF